MTSVLYFIIFAFLIVILVLFLQSINSRYPSWTFGHGGTIGPGVSKLPRPSNDSEVDRYEVMFYDSQDRDSHSMYRESLHRCFGANKDRSSEERNGMSCRLKEIRDLEEINSSNWFNFRDCREVDFEDCLPCSECGDYGYSNESPCFAIGANRVLNWRPIPYRAQELPPDMPDYLTQIYSEECLHVSCDGDYQEIGYRAANIKNIEEINYFPSTCIPVTTFRDFSNQTCRSKSIRVSFKIPANIPVTVRCRLWAKNIDYDYRLRKGTTTFTIMHGTDAGKIRSRLGKATMG
ncbi:sodium/potassium-transporting ATPase subunit beta-1-like [Galendromus occidentalis]|uniref:Sodium/potassium-transporting ATPase subunit beta-1-like n=1 Tax=Galendromus occidentalis TaxID=34638 RepID=A0AAJ6QR67_9ACAR|nr:sodium/potassium-transporting ATPase subunit beta-1-like [Galendromus occidentalis]